MTWPAGGISTANVDATSDDPELAVVQIKAAIDQLNQLIAHVSVFMQGVLDDADAAAVFGSLGISAYIQTLLNDADAATARTTLGVPAATDGALVRPTITNPSNVGQTLIDAATVAWDTNSGAVGTVTLAGNRTMGTPTNLKVNGNYVLHALQDGTGSRTLSFPSAFKWPLGVAPVLSTTAGARDVFTFTSDGTNLYGAMLKGMA